MDDLDTTKRIEDNALVELAHGGGGRKMQELLHSVFLRNFSNPFLFQYHDSTQLPFVFGKKTAVTTDSYVVDPLFFPGGDIGSLSVYGTVNDLAMSGARPLYLTAGFILEEGFPISDLVKIVTSMQKAAQKCNVSFVAGDTKVVDRGKGDGVFINTTGIGVIEHNLEILPRSIQVGDAILLCGDLGRHGVAILTKREGMEFDTEIGSDCDTLQFLVFELIQQGFTIHCLRDLTRGGLASALNELAAISRFCFEIEEIQIPICREVHAACEILGFDPLYVANEGAFVAFIPMKEAEKAKLHLQSVFPEKQISIIGQVQRGEVARVFVTNFLGTKRILDLFSGEQLPRIC